MKRGAIPLNALRAFESAARLGKMSDAAEELCVTHSAISRQVRSLENYLGVKLFEGPRNRLVLTREGRELLPHLTVAFDSIQSAVSNISTRDRKVIDVSCLGTLAMRWLIPRLFDFHDKHPGMEIRLTSDDGPVDFRCATVDVAIRVGHDLDTGSGAEATPLFLDKVGPVLSPAKLPHGTLRSPCELAGFTFLHTRTRPGAWADWCRDIGVDLHTEGREFEHFYFMLEAATAGLGVAIAPEILVRDDIAAGRLAAPFGFRPNGMRYMALTAAPSNGMAQTFVNWLVSKAHEEHQLPLTDRTSCHVP